jgi:hypothetical protein
LPLGEDFIIQSITPFQFSNVYTLAPGYIFSTGDRRVHLYRDLFFLTAQLLTRQNALYMYKLFREMYLEKKNEYIINARRNDIGHIDKQKYIFL